VHRAFGPSIAALTVVLCAAGAGAAVLVGQGVPVAPPRFARGACVAYPPSSGNLGRTVYLDAGHGGPDPGAVGVTRRGATIEEARLTLPVVLDATTLLRAAGYEVVDSRTRDSSVVRLRRGYVDGGIFTLRGKHADLVARDDCADIARASIVIGVYFNAGPAQDAGSLTLYDAARPFWRASRRLARLVQRDVLRTLGSAHRRVPDDGVHSDVGYGHGLTSADDAYGHLVLLGPAKKGYLSTPTTMPGALIEPLFITDSAEGSIAASAAGQQAIARGLLRAVEQYFALAQSTRGAAAAAAGRVRRAAASDHSRLAAR
jgi:N-acetylmuramoyl-L-alanine amidase